MKYTIELNDLKKENKHIYSPGNNSERLELNDNDLIGVLVDDVMKFAYVIHTEDFVIVYSESRDFTIYLPKISIFDDNCDHCNAIITDSKNSLNDLLINIFAKSGEHNLLKQAKIFNKELEYMDFDFLNHDYSDKELFFGSSKAGKTSRFISIEKESEALKRYKAIMEEEFEALKRYEEIMEIARSLL